MIGNGGDTNSNKRLIKVNKWGPLYDLLIKIKTCGYQDSHHQSDKRWDQTETLGNKTDGATKRALINESVQPCWCVIKESFLIKIIVVFHLSGWLHQSQTCRAAGYLSTFSFIDTAMSYRYCKVPTARSWTRGHPCHQLDNDGVESNSDQCSPSLAVELSKQVPDKKQINPG